MAGRGTDIILGGNSEFLAKEEMRRKKMPHELIEEANTYYETDDEDILNARKQFKELVDNMKNKSKKKNKKLSMPVA